MMYADKHNYTRPEMSARGATRLARQPARHWHDDRGEGVISAAIAVLIVAFLGAGMWVAFDAIWSDAKDDIEEQVGKIGSSSSSPLSPEEPSAT